jgi:hypothetical protein
MVVQDESGRADFHATRAALSREPQRLAFFAFDLLILDDRDLRDEPLSERRRVLQDLLGSADLPQIAFSGAVPGTRPKLFAAAEALGLESIVSKDLASPTVSAHRCAGSRRRLVVTASSTSSAWHAMRRRSPWRCWLVASCQTSFVEDRVLAPADPPVDPRPVSLRASPGQRARPDRGGGRHRR